MIKAVVFDFDGVILESAEIKTEAFRKLFQEDYPELLGRIIEHHKRNMGISRYVKFKYIYEEILGLAFTNESEKKLGERFEEIVLKEILQVPFVPGIMEFLENYSGSYYLFIASGTPELELISIVQKRNMIDFFKGIYGSPSSKSEIITGITNRFHWDPSEVVFIGDGTSDYIAAQETGVHFIGRIHPGGNELPGCKYRMNDLFELKNLIDRLSFGPICIGE